MRRELVVGGTKEEAEEKCSWASVIIEVEGGWMCFESVDDARTREAQI